MGDPSSSAPASLDDRTAAPSGRAVPAAGEDLRQTLRRECDAMARHALGMGGQLPFPVAQALERMAREGADPEFADLVALHNRLAEMIAPALPRTITLLREDPSQGRWLAVLGALPTIRRLTCLSLIFTGLFMLSALSGHVNEASMRSGILTMSGLDLLEVLVFILAAAGMGACFQALFTAQRYVVAGTYDPRHDSDYWTRIVLGLTAGLMLAELIPHDKMGEQGQLMAKPLLALLGGFSASLVYRVLARLVETVEGLFAGDARDRTQALTQAARAQTTALTARQRMETATSLLGLQERLARGGTPQEMSQAVGELIRTLVPETNGPPSGPPSGPLGQRGG